MLDNTPNQLSKFRTKIWIKINDQSSGVYKFKTTMLNSLCDYSDANIFVKGRITITGAGADAAARQADKRDKEVIIKNCALFTNFKTKVNNTKIDNTEHIDVVMSMHILVE